MAEQTNSRNTAAAGAKPAAGNGNGITKKEAVRQALKGLGRNAKPAQLQPYIKATFGLDMTPAHITTAKGELHRGKAKAAGRKQEPPSKSPAVAAAPQQSAPKAPQGGNGDAGGVSLKDLGVVKELLGRVGADGLRTLINLLAQ